MGFVTSGNYVQIATKWLMNDQLSDITRGRRYYDCFPIDTSERSLGVWEYRRTVIREVTHGEGSHGRSLCNTF